MVSGNYAQSSERNYPLNCWWVAAFADEVSSQPLARSLLGTIFFEPNGTLRS